MPTPLNNLIHVATLRRKGRKCLLFLRKQEQHYIWYEVEEEREVATSVTSDSAEEAIRLARRYFAPHFFETLRCGFRFTLPERDEIGTNALFHQMVSSYSAGNGVYLDEELGHQCFVNEASQEALTLWRRLQPLIAP